jgi:NADH-quinone oxidoreductase subunit I
MGYFRDLTDAVVTLAKGLTITLRYCFARTITVQYPQVAPVLQGRFRGIHRFEIEKCIACDNCAKACPVDCIYIEADSRGKNTHLSRYAIDYGKCMFCGLCIDPCPTDCIHMGNNHDLSAYSRAGLVVEFVELARQGQQTPVPLWMTTPPGQLPDWAVVRQAEWHEANQAATQAMKVALTPVAERPKPTPPTKTASAA